MKTYNIDKHDQHLDNYIVLKNGKKISPAMTLESCVQEVRILEKKVRNSSLPWLNLSPYTIGRK